MVSILQDFRVRAYMGPMERVLGDLGIKVLGLLPGESWHGEWQMECLSLFFFLTHVTHFWGTFDFHPVLKILKMCLGDSIFGLWVSVLSWWWQHCLWAFEYFGGRPQRVMFYRCYMPDAFYLGHSSNSWTLLYRITVWLMIQICLLPISGICGLLSWSLKVWQLWLYSSPLHKTKPSTYVLFPHMCSLPCMWKQALQPVLLIVLFWIK